MINESKNRGEKIKLRPSFIADKLGVEYSSNVSKEYKKSNGQFFTPIEISHFMGEIATSPKCENISILDPGFGVGVLTCSLIESLMKYGIHSIKLVAFETDNNLIPFSQKTIDYLKEWLCDQNIHFDYELHNKDFVKELGLKRNVSNNRFDYVISNPPYFKLSKSDQRVNILKDVIKGQPNIYSLFMSISCELLNSRGEMIFIVPRSFASGLYFNSFRDYFFRKVHPSFIHLFKSRNKTFNRDKVLQETLVVRAGINKVEKVELSTSDSLEDLNNSFKREFNVRDIIDLESKEKILHLPTSLEEERTMFLFKSWRHVLSDFDIAVSTGPVVSFRSRQFLFDVYQNSTVFLVPLFWLHNVKKMEIEWPKLVKDKSQYINITDKSKRLLIENQNCILLRRFSSKDDKSRLIAAPYLKEISNSDYIGIENKLNYIYRKNGDLTKYEVLGISALLNSKLFDTYFRTINGNVNVSATEIRLMKFPPLEKITELGRKIHLTKKHSEETIDGAVNEWFNINTMINE